MALIENQRKILRTLFLTVSTDEQLRELAHKLRTSKGDLIRKAIEEFLEKEKAKEK